MGSFRTTVYVGTVGGKKLRKTVTAKSRRELDKKVMELKLEVARGKDCYSTATFDQWAEKWMNEVVLPKGVSRATVVKYQSAITHMDRVFHGVRLRDIRLSDMQQLINSLAICNPNTGVPAAKATLVNIRKVGNAIFRYARQNNIEGVPNFFDILQIPVNAPVKKRRALTSEEVDLVLNVPHWAQPMAMVMLFCGLRQGECVPLQWEDVDFEKRVLRVVRSADLQNNIATVKDGGKTMAAKRVVPMPDVLLEYLLWYQDAQATGEFAAQCGAGDNDRAPSYQYPPSGGIDTPLVFTNLQGGLQSKSSLRRMWDDYMRELNEARERIGVSSEPEQLTLAGFLEDTCTLEETDPAAASKESATLREPIRFTAHNLRHTYATMLYLQNVDIRDAMAYMGHTTYQVTLGIYTDTEQYCRFDMEPALVNRLRTDFRIPKPEF